jgi:diguanylate cyclase (GGDEF)-like protein/PAS domain S-box-containing protein
MRAFLVIKYLIVYVFIAGFLLSNETAATQVSNKTSQLVRHPLETNALTDPKGVLKILPGKIQNAKASNNYEELALLYLAESNACRVIADWKCQSLSGHNARLAAENADLPELQVRGLIAESRGVIALQDFTYGEDLLGDAERLLELHPSPELSAEIFLAYSSLSYAIGKNALAAEYATRGLNSLAHLPSLPIRIRLLRNQARALAQLDKPIDAENILNQAVTLSKNIQDPKLSIATQIDSGEKILALADLLKNSQLTGLAYEVLGLAALNKNDNVSAEAQLHLAQKSFRELKLYRDERRVLRSLITSMVGRNKPQVEIEKLSTRLIELGWSLESDDRKLAADDFDARLKYAKQKLDLQKLELNASLNKERENAAKLERRFLTITAFLSTGLLLVMGILFLLQRRYGKKLQLAISQLSVSEFNYRILAENSRDLVVRMQPSGHRLYTSPSVKDMLGYEPEELMEPRWDLIHPDDMTILTATIKSLTENGGSATVLYRVKHRNGSYIWIEALARLVINSEHKGESEIIYSGRDVSTRIKAEQALHASDSRMRAITDNIPAIIAQIDKDQRYVFVNAYTEKVLGFDQHYLIGKTMREARGDEHYIEVQPHVEEVMQGNRVRFERSKLVDGKLYHFQSNYMPDYDENGSVQGFYVLSFNITALKNAEANLDKLSRIDSLTEVANRRHFDEQLSAALARTRRQQNAITLLYLDIDNFKTINDTHGHLVGDAAIIAFAKRLQSCVREGDLIARLGGDEFVVLIENPSPESGEIMAKKLLLILQQALIIDEITLPLTASIGVAYCTKAPDAKTLMNLADQALYDAKQAGRNTYRVKLLTTATKIAPN